MQSGGTLRLLPPKFWPFGAPPPRSACAKPAPNVASWPAPAAAVRQPEAFASNATRRTSPNVTISKMKCPGRTSPSATMRIRLSRSRHWVRCPNRAQWPARCDRCERRSGQLSFWTAAPRHPALKPPPRAAGRPRGEPAPLAAAAGHSSASQNVYYRSILPAYNTHVCSSFESIMRVNKYKLMCPRLPPLRLRKNTKT